LAFRVADFNLQFTLSIESLSTMLPREELNSQRSLYEGRDGTIRGYNVVDGTVLITVSQGVTRRVPLELLREWPEVVEISAKLVRGERLDEMDKLWIREVAEATGWGVDDVIEEFKSLDVDPSERVERYRSLFETYYREALAHREKGDTRQAGEKMWGAVIALIKLYAATKGIYVSHWNLPKLYYFVENNVEVKYRNTFMKLLNQAFVLHTHFYEAHLSSTAFEIQWEEVVKLVEEVREIVFKRLAKASA